MGPQEAASIRDPSELCLSSELTSLCAKSCWPQHKMLSRMRSKAAAACGSGVCWLHDFVSICAVGCFRLRLFVSSVRGERAEQKQRHTWFLRIVLLAPPQREACHASPGGLPSVPCVPGRLAIRPWEASHASQAQNAQQCRAEPQEQLQPKSTGLWQKLQARHSQIPLRHSLKCTR